MCVCVCMCSVSDFCIFLSLSLCVSPRTLQIEYEQLKEQHGGQRGPGSVGRWDPEGSSHPRGPDEAEMLAEAKLLRQHKGRLEARMHILEEHNKQLESQLHRLRQLLHQVGNTQRDTYSIHTHKHTPTQTAC